MGNSAHHHGRDGMFKDELFLVVRFQHEGVFVEALNAPGQLDAAHQIDREHDLVLACIIQETVLYVLRRLIHAAPKNPFGKVKQCPIGASIVPYSPL